MIINEDVVMTVVTHQFYGKINCKFCIWNKRDEVGNGGNENLIYTDYWHSQDKEVTLDVYADLGRMRILLAIFKRPPRRSEDNYKRNNLSETAYGTANWKEISQDRVQRLILFSGTEPDTA
jgi:hypothetical protein